MASFSFFFLCDESVIAFQNITNKEEDDRGYTLQACKGRNKSLHKKFKRRARHPIENYEVITANKSALIHRPCLRW